MNVRTELNKKSKTKKKRGKIEINVKVYMPNCVVVKNLNFFFFEMIIEKQIFRNITIILLSLIYYLIYFFFLLICLLWTMHYPATVTQPVPKIILLSCKIQIKLSLLMLLLAFLKARVNSIFILRILFASLNVFEMTKLQLQLASDCLIRFSELGFGCVKASKAP